MGHVVSMERTRKKLKSSPNKSSVASIPVLTNHISQYLSKEDLASIHSTSKTQSDASSKNISYVEAKCTVETVDGLTCDTESVPASCTHWCKQKKTSSSLMRFYAFLKLFSHEGATFKFENQPADYTQFDVEISETNKISLLLADRTVYTLRPNNRENSFSETDTSYKYRKQDTDHIHPPEVMLRKFELLVSKPFSEWGEWKLILEAHLFSTYKRCRDSDFMNKNEVMAGAIYFKGISVPCKGEIMNICDRGHHTIHIYIDFEDSGVTSVAHKLPQ